jgi:hypothetical protein
MSKSNSMVAVASALCVLGQMSQTDARTGNRVWVSGHGKDVAGCGATTDPCRNFQYVHDNIVTAGGEIDVLDPADYGTLTIKKALSIINDGVGTASVEATTAGKTAITINAGPTDSIYLRGLTLEGLEIAENGIQFDSGAFLTISETTISNFKGVGVNFTPNNGSGIESALAISGGSVTSMGSGDIVVKPSGGTQARATIKDVSIGQSVAGVITDGSSNDIGWAQTTLSGCSLYDLKSAVIATSSAGVAYIVVDHTTVGHTTTALSASGSKTVIDVSYSTLVYDLTISSTANGGVVHTFGNNTVDFFATLGVLTPSSLK